MSDVWLDIVWDLFELLCEFNSARRFMGFAILLLTAIWHIHVYSHSEPKVIEPHQVRTANSGHKLNKGLLGVGYLVGGVLFGSSYLGRDRY